MQLDNQFSVTSIDPKTFNYPRVEVAVWSSMFDKGGSVNIEAKTPEGRRLTLYKIEIEENRSVVDEREECQELADEWNEDCEQNWKNEILRCYTYVRDYQQKKVDAIDEERKELDKYNKIISKLEKSAPTHSRPTKSKGKK